jgi:hypothetical protein
MHALLLALSLGQATPAAPVESIPPAAPAPAAARTTRPIELTLLPDGRFLATLDGAPVAGADFYRAVLRPDLAARLDDARNLRTGLWIGAGLAPLAGAGLGWVAGTAQRRQVGCDQPVAPITDPYAIAECERVRRWNRTTVRNATLVGLSGGLAAGLALWLGGLAIHLPEPTAAEAEALVKRYRAHGARLELEAGPGEARLALRGAF